MKNKGLAVIFFSFIVLCIGVIVIHIIEPGQSLLKVIFECVSAYGTADLSLGITPALAWGSKLVVMLLMFFGRMGPIALLMIFLSKQKSQPYRYPSDTIVIT